MTIQRGNSTKKLFEPIPPKSIDEFIHSSKAITEADKKLYYEAAKLHIQKDYTKAREKYEELLKRKHLQSNKVIKGNIKSLNAKK